MSCPHIIGSGLAGLLAANMLSYRKPVIFEQQPKLPNNHSAVMRFKSSIVGDVLNIPFRSVRMIKAALPWKNPVADALAYSFKNGGIYRSDRSVTQGLVSDERFIAPLDLISQMAEHVDIRYGVKFDLSQVDHNTPIISTVPMPILMDLLEYRDKPKFSYVHGCNLLAKIPHCDAYISLLVPDPQYAFSRISLMGSQLIIECSNSAAVVVRESSVHILEQATYLLGISAQPYDIDCREQLYSKINPIDENLRKNFIHWATVKHNIYSLGRFATWRPKLLIDDLVNDIRLIDRWLGQSSKYDIARSM